jgi:hypothetical protein
MSNHTGTSERYFDANIDVETFYFFGASFAEAMERLLGRCMRPLLRPDQTSIVLYGDVFTPDHPGIYKWR